MGKRIQNRYKWTKKQIINVARYAVVHGYDAEKIRISAQLPHTYNAVRGLMYKIGMTKHNIDYIMHKHTTQKDRFKAAMIIVVSTDFGRAYDSDYYAKNNKKFKMCGKKEGKTYSLKDALIILFAAAVLVNLVMLFLTKYWGGF